MDPNKPDAKYNTYKEMHAAEKEQIPISFEGGPRDQSRVIACEEELPSEYDCNELFDNEVAPKLTEIRDILNSNNIPFLFIAAPACNAEGSITNCCIGYLPGTRTPMVYRTVSSILKDGGESFIQAIGEKQMMMGKAMGMVELESVLNNIEEDKFKKDHVITVVRAHAANLMLDQLFKHGSDATKEKLASALSGLENFKESEDGSETPKDADKQAE